MLGSQFKELRTEQNISLKEAAKDIVAVSTLSRWENDQTELQFDKVLQLLENIHISPLEFLSITVLYPKTPLIDEISKAQHNGSKIELKRISTRYLNLYKATHNKYDLFDAAIACNFYYEVADKNIFPTSYQKLLEQYLSDVTHWTHYYISLLGNTVHLLSPKRIFGLALLIIEDLENVKRGGYEYYVDAILTLLNAYHLLIDKDLDLAQKLSRRFNAISLSKYSMYEKIQRNFLNALLKFKITNDNTDVARIIYHVKGLGMEDLAKQYLDLLKSI